MSTNTPVYEQVAAELGYPPDITVPTLDQLTEHQESQQEAA